MVLYYEQIKRYLDIFDREQYFEKVEVDETYPDYIRKNFDSLKDWIV